MIVSLPIPTRVARSLLEHAPILAVAAPKKQQADLFAFAMHGAQPVVLLVRDWRSIERH